MAPRASFNLDSLATAIPAVFDQAQTSAATHKKNSVALYKLQTASADVVESVNRGRNDVELKLVGERAFSEAFMDMLNRVLVVKKSTPAADRIVKFVATYVKFLNDKASESDEEETPSSRFVARLLKYFLKGFQAKSKEVRFRCLNFVSEIVPSVGELDQDLYAELRAALMQRLADKEPLVRIHSVTALSFLASSEDPYDLEDDEPPIINSLLTTLFYDSAAEVRRAALVHLPFTPTTLPALLTRMRDVDALTRKLVFTAVLPRLANSRQLTIAQREQVASQGLGDRTEAVRIAAARLLGTWVDTCEGDLSAFIALFDVYTSDVACDALKSVFVTRAEIVNEIEFDDTFWTNLKPETALLARAFVEHCIDKSDDARLEATLPVVTALAFRLQTAYNGFLALAQGANDEGGLDEDEDEAREEQAANTEFVMSELLRLAAHLDYTDEIGRRKMFSVVRDMLAHPDLPESLIEPCVGVLHIMSPNERDLIRVAVEVVSELRDPEPEDEESMVRHTLPLLRDAQISQAVDDENNDGESTIATARPGGLASRSHGRKDVCEMTPEEKVAADVIDLRCLSLCIAVLGRIHGSFEENSTLRGVLEELIVPSVQRKELALREKGLINLGLCCLIAKNMALSSFQLFLSQVKSSPESLRMKVLQVVFDIMITYEKDLFGSAESIGERVVTFLMQVLEAEESQSVQALMCLGLAKLMLFGLITDERVLMSLIFAYVSPTNADNQELRQCLAYFLPVYCYSSAVNQMRLQSVFMKTLDLIFQTYEELEDDQDMVTPLQFGQLLIDWTDASKVVGTEEQNDMSPVHIHLAIDIVRALYNNERTVEERRTLCHFLGKLIFPSVADQHLLYTLYVLIVNLTELCPFEDAATDRAFLRFKTRFESHFATALADYDEPSCFHDSDGAYDETFEFLGITRPKQRRFEGKAYATTSSRASRVRRDGSEARASPEAEVEQGPPRAIRSRQNAKAKAKADVRASSAENSSGSSSEIEDDDDQATETERKLTTAVSSRPRKAKGKVSVAPEAAASSDSEHEADEDPDPGSDSRSEVVGGDEDEERNTPIPTTPPRKRGAKRLHTPTKSPSMASPAPKRQNRGVAAVTARRGRKANTSRPPSSTVVEPLKNAANKRVKSTTRGAEPARKHGRPPAKLRSPSVRLSEDGADEKDSGASSSDVSVLQRRPRAGKRSAPRVMEEKTGWDDTSDF